MSSLDAYRKKASFDVVALKNLVETAEVVEFRERIWETLANDPLFSKSSAELTCDEQQLLTFRRTKRVVEYEFVATEEYMQFPMRLYSMLQALYVADPCIPAEFFLSAQVKERIQRPTSLLVTLLIIVFLSVFLPDVWIDHPDW